MCACVSNMSSEDRKLPHGQQTGSLSTFFFFFLIHSFYFTAIVIVSLSLISSEEAPTRISNSPSSTTHSKCLSRSLNESKSSLNSNVFVSPASSVILSKPLSSLSGVIIEETLSFT